jgi:rhamnose transport system permease protein
MLKRSGREIALAATIALLMLTLSVFARGYFSGENLADLFIENMPVMFVALGMTLTIVTGEIDISVGSIFAVASVVAALSSKAGFSTLESTLVACAVGALCGAGNGALVAYVRVPSIVVTLATMVALRDGLRWLTQGAWIGNLPERFQWFGATQTNFLVATVALVAAAIALFGAGLRYLHWGRAMFATGSNEAAARMVGIDTSRVKFSVFVLTGLLTGLAAMLNSARFNQVPSNSGLGLEMKVIAAVVVGGASIRGGSATVAGTVLGVILLGSIGTALTFLGISAYWERAIEGAIILVALTVNALTSHRSIHAKETVLAG